MLSHLDYTVTKIHGSVTKPSILGLFIAIIIVFLFCFSGLTSKPHIQDVFLLCNFCLLSYVNGILNVRSTNASFRHAIVEGITLRDRNSAFLDIWVKLHDIPLVG